MLTTFQSFTSLMAWMPASMGHLLLDVLSEPCGKVSHHTAHQLDLPRSRATFSLGIWCPFCRLATEPPGGLRLLCLNEVLNENNS
ncbi:hypothetical protein E5676_scaffold250G001030 [Cucumis melo var. makuwa]|uniref:Secreted protein n=1 Tax=Cucumis melo var. makuwa TaxID=1194695 RepID=A0A5D3DK15_CUCMM|nr:hypothetical protein E6C27_scaffold89G001750 [Cucumis melo var. makuwa]TYK24011.1 hypothetical protein E5676_scaffold250G001030 [Cucumis melo var. makuwa]